MVVIWLTVGTVRSSTPTTVSNQRIGGEMGQQVSGANAASVTLTVVFLACAGAYLRAALISRGWARGAWACHVVMALAMVAMVWAWGMEIPLIVYVVVFTAAATYFVYLWLERIDCATGNHRLYHAVMMASMVLMALVMFAPAAGGGTGHAGGHRHSSASDMPMSMPGMDAGGGGLATSMPAWASAVAAIAATGYAVVALGIFYVIVRGPRRPYADLLMSAGMAGAFALML
ncbi:hypothetical protein GCM10027169_32370 [Gordonia jinhuaensis]|uniref:DUF5134 domain-containing protein n=1 Tax=Gordonia jinhuaensis TaxID=1517702 RepID=A0A916T5Y5_9ACTN|nr:hypothetical protein GCM10011489_21510 [Gordonia jinhuaensis]